MTQSVDRRVVVAGGATGQESVFADRLLPAAVVTETAIVHDLVEIDAHGEQLPEDLAWHHDPASDGAIFRIVRLKPVSGSESRPLHGSPTIDIGFVISGTVELTLPEGASRALSQGDSFVLRGIDHSWTNRGPEDCEFAVVLLQPSQWPSNA